MKPTLNIGIGQQLTLTPQLQQAIKLLQLSSLELEQEIQQALESNPMLEIHEEAEKTVKQQLDESRETIQLDKETLPKDLPVDTAWEDAMQTQSSTKSKGQALGPNVERQQADDPDLHQHLLWQLNIAHFSPTDHVIGLAILDGINDEGLLTTSVDELVLTLNRDADDELTVSEEEVFAVLRQIQNFDPVGVAARDLQECLSIQLAALPPSTPHLKYASALVNNHFDLLRKKEMKKIAKKLGLDESALKDVVSLIQTLSPYPGYTVVREESNYVIPDVIISKGEKGWDIKLNGESLPKVSINKMYAGIMQGAKGSADYQYLRDNMQEAKWFLKSLQSRNETLLKVVESIFRKQDDFLENGDEAMKPLVLQDIAQEIEMHESTVSRVTTNKYALTPQGLYELKYFFSSHVATDAGGECSSTAIRAQIKKLISNEDPRKPLSDAKITEELKNIGINVARRTIAKYRESLRIPPSNERKSLV